jgi:1,6-anhydro-N-acetylmuramate kinase
MGFYLGLMSGTSVDAIDADFTGAAGARIVGGVYRYA